MGRCCGQRASHRRHFRQADGRPLRAYHSKECRAPSETPNLSVSLRTAMRFGTGSPLGQSSVQYPHRVQGTVSIRARIPDASRSASCSAPLSGARLSKRSMFCSSCSSVDMPLRTVATRGRDAAKRSAQAAGVYPGVTRFSMSMICGLSCPASMPPLTGSMTITSMPYFSATA